MEDETRILKEDEMYCRSCGAVIKKQAEICVHCGVRAYQDTSPAFEGQPTIKPVIGGILGVIAGVFPLIGGVVLISIGIAASGWTDSAHWVPIAIGIPVFALGVMTIIGSSYAIARKNFPLAIVGGACSIFSMWMLGIPALILIAVSSKEFYTAQEE
jgi:cbb3-type cytochrome oxidase subunit 1